MLATLTFASIAADLLGAPLATAVVIGFVAGIKVVRAVFGFVPAGIAAILLVVAAVSCACVLGTTAAAVFGLAGSSGTVSVPKAVKLDMVLHSRPLLMVPVDNTFVVAATVAVAGVFLTSLSASMSGGRLGFAVGMDLLRPFSV